MARAALLALLLPELLFAYAAACEHFCTNSCDESIVLCFRMPCNPSEARPCSAGGECLPDCTDTSDFEERVAETQGDPDEEEERPWKVMALPFVLIGIIALCGCVLMWYFCPWQRCRHQEKALDLERGEAPRIHVMEAKESPKRTKLGSQMSPQHSVASTSATPAMSHVLSGDSATDYGPTMSATSSYSMSPTASKMSHTGSKVSHTGSKASKGSKSRSEGRDGQSSARSRSESRSHRSKRRSHDRHHGHSERAQSLSPSDSRRSSKEYGSPSGSRRHSKERLPTVHSIDQEVGCHIGKTSSKQSSPAQQCVAQEGEPSDEPSEDTDSLSDIFVQVRPSATASSGLRGGGAVDPIAPWEALVEEAKQMLERDDQEDYAAERKHLSGVDDLLTRASEGLDCLQLTPRGRDKRRELLEMVESLEADFAMRWACLQMDEPMARRGQPPRDKAPNGASYASEASDENE